MKHILVIGGTGFIGYNFIKKAISKNYKITSLSLNPPRIERHIRGVKYIQVDMSNFKELKKKLKGNYAYILNCGGYGKHPDFGKEGNKLIKTHYNGLLNVLKILTFKKLQLFIQIGSSTEYGKKKGPLKEEMRCNPKTPYAIAKNLCTNILINLNKKKEFPVVILRLFQAYGPGQDENRLLPYIIKKCKKNLSFNTTLGEQLCDFCHIDDVVSAIFKCFASKKINGQILNISSGEPRMIKSIILRVKKIIGKGNPIFGGLKYNKQISMKNFASINKAKKILNWSPKIKFLDGLKKTIDSYK